jgi:parvulin-like peptidyl-prolyl isomerase
MARISAMLPRRGLIVVALAVAVVPACGGVFDVAAATVDERQIEEDTFVRQLDFVLADPRFAQQFPGAEGDEQRKIEARNLLTFLIHQQIVQDYADEHGISVSQEEVQQQLDLLITQLGGRQAFDAQIRQSGATTADVEELVRHQILRQKVADTVVAEEVGDEQLMQTYEERIAEFTQVRVSHILVDDEEKARDILKDATPGNFPELARKFSKDPGSAQQGGELGLQRPADLVEPFGQATLDIPVGEVGGPVETEFGFHVIWVQDRETQPFEDVRGQLLEEVRGQVFTEWLVERLEGSEIRVNPRYGYYDRASGQVIERTATTPEPPVQVVP